MLLLLHLWLLVTSATLAAYQESLCLALGGDCVREGDCWSHTIHNLCVHPHVCCHTADRRLPEPVTIERVVGGCQRTGKCVRSGGQCVPVDSPCSTWKVNNMCKGSCSCCLGEHRSCAATVTCKLQGGFCYKGKKKLCVHGTILPDACGKRECTCCLPRKCSCGMANGERIVGGTELVSPHKYPWLVGLKLPKKKDGYYCGGTIITARYIITAAHCLYDQDTGRVIKSKFLKVGVGDHNQWTTQDDVQGVTALVDVQNIIVHEKYSFFETFHDIGLVRLAQELDLVSHLQLRAACLPTNPSDMFEGTTGMVYGWGIIQTGDLKQPGIAREVALPILDKDCQGKTLGFMKITSSMLCAGDEKGGKDTCLGDSGGPLTVLKDQRHILVGITSFGIGCGIPGSPGVYTRVSAYLDWITANVKDDSFCN